MSKLATNQKLLIMALAAVLLPVAMIWAAPMDQQNTTENTDCIEITDSPTGHPTESIGEDSLLQTPVECYCNLPECLLTNDSSHTCTTRLGCFFELQAVDHAAPNVTRSQEADKYKTVLIGGHMLNGAFGCLEFLPINRTCKAILKSMENDESEFPDLHSSSSSNQTKKMKTYHCCDKSMCNEHSVLPNLGEKDALTVLVTVLALMNDIDIENQNNSATTNIPTKHNTETDKVLSNSLHNTNLTTVGNGVSTVVSIVNVTTEKNSVNTLKVTSQNSNFDKELSIDESKLLINFLLENLKQYKRTYGLINIDIEPVKTTTEIGASLTSVTALNMSSKHNTTELIQNTELIKTTELIPTTDPNSSHKIKKRHDGANESPLHRQADDEPVSGARALHQPEVLTNEKAEETVDPYIRPQNSGFTDVSHYHPNIAGMHGWISNTNGLLVIIGIIGLGIVFVLMLVAVKLTRKVGVFLGIKEYQTKPMGMFNGTCEHPDDRSGINNIKFNSDLFIDSTGDTTYVYTTVPVMPSTKVVHVRR